MTIMLKKTYIYWVLFLLFGLVSLGQLQRIELSFGRAIYLHEILMSGWVFLSFCLLPSTWNSVLKHRLVRVFLLFDVWIITNIVGSAIFSHVSPLTPFLYLARLNVYVGFGLNLHMLIRRGKVTGMQVKQLLLTCIFLVAGLGLCQYFFLPDTRSLVFLGWDNHYLRLISTLFDPGFTGAVLTMGVLLLFYDLIRASNKRWAFLFAQLQFFILTLALLLTYSRASFLALVAGLVYLFLKDKRTAYLVLLAGFAFSVLLLPRPRSEGARLERTASVVARVETVRVGLKGLSPAEMVVGSSWYSQKKAETRDMGGSRVTSHNSAPENSFVFVFTSLGLVGLVLFLTLGNRLYTQYAKRPEVLAIFLAMSVHACFSNTLFYPFVMFFLTVAMVCI